jgi:hypothetical protein
MKLKVIGILLVIATLVSACSNEADIQATELQKPTNSVQQNNNEVEPTKRLTNTPQATNTLIPTLTPMPTKTLAPTETPNINLVKPGTHLVGIDIQPGIYKGKAGKGMFDSCYWARLKDLTGELIGSIIANDNAIGQFYIEVKETDYALEVACPIERLETIPQVEAYPTHLEPGTYLVGYDIKPGLYKGEAGADILGSCYWERKSNLTGEIGSILANDNSIGQFYIQVGPTDYALKTSCPIDWISD